MKSTTFKTDFIGSFVHDSDKVLW